MEYRRGDDILQILAEAKGIEDLDTFLYPKENALHSPYLLDNIEKARDIIVDAIKNKKKISILADVDFDGSASCAEKYLYLKNFTNKVTYFHAQRSDGHGAEKVLDSIPEGTELLIIVDSSTSSTDACKEISERGIDIVILDHHESECPNPYATIVNPQMDNYPNKQISGSVVVWKMCQVLDDYFRTKHSKHMIDIAGLGLIADQMSMAESENRYIVYKALTNIKNKGILSILELAKKDIRELTTTDIQFSVSPQINAASRMDRIELALELLTCEDTKECVRLAKELSELNEKRKEIQEQFTKKFEQELNEKNKVFVIVDEEIGKGFAGLVAGDLANKYERPVLVLSPVNDRVQGSFRTYEDFQMKSFLASCPQIDFTAGHMESGGVGLPQNKVEEFITYVNNILADHEFAKTKGTVIVTHVDDITSDLIKRVTMFNRITGKGMKPVKFLVQGLFVSDKELLGKKKKNTVKVDCGNMKLMKFRTNEEYYNTFPLLTEIEAVGILNLNKWRDWKQKKDIITIQLFLEDYRTI